MIVSSVKGNETNTEETSSLDKEGGKYRQMRRKERPNRRPRAYLVCTGNCTTAIGQEGETRAETPWEPR
ncbi:hypothetical protein G6F55_014581 [Rhizopus delemar]|nr:hypothetical protein G6F55_014581 [Rhizopus delemar]